jgi:phage-related protein
VDKQIIWMGQSLKELRDMPEDVQDEVGFALDTAQRGGKVAYAAPMKRRLRTVTEIRVDEDGDTYRAMYTTEMEGFVYVLDVFKKKSKKGVATPKEDIDRIAGRLKRAREHFKHVKDNEDEDTE